LPWSTCATRATLRKEFVMGVFRFLSGYPD
jgi:hypothetical protein